VRQPWTGLPIRHFPIKPIVLIFETGSWYNFPMSAFRESNRERRLPTGDVLRALHREVGVEGSLQDELVASLYSAQQAAIAELSVPSRPYGVVLVYDSGDAIDSRIGPETFAARLLAIRQTRPVLYFDIPSLEMQTGAIVTRDDLASSFTYGVEKATPVLGDKARPDQNTNLYPQLNIDTINRDNWTTQGELHRGIERFLDKYKTNTGRAVFALRYSEVFADKFQRDLNAFLFDYQDLSYAHILVTTIAKAEIGKDYGSPWMSKVSFDQLKVLKESDVVDLLVKFEDVLGPSQKDKIRYLVANYGSGKTATLKAMKALGVPGAAYLIDLLPLAEQQEVLDGNVIFIDEAVVRTDDELKQINETVERNDGVAIMLVPNQEAKKIVEERINQ